LKIYLYSIVGGFQKHIILLVNLLIDESYCAAGLENFFHRQIDAYYQFQEYLHYFDGLRF